MMKVLAMCVLMVCVAGCTANERAKHWGGTMTSNLPKGEKLVNCTWKEGGSLWLLTKKMKDTDVAETYTFTENSSWGMIQGKVVIQETK